MKIYYLYIFLFTILLSCSSLKIKNKHLNSDDVNYEEWYTIYKNYQRNPLIKSEIAPPIQLFAEEKLIGLPWNGFTNIKNIMLLGSTNGYVQAYDLKTADVIGKKKMGNTTLHAPTIYKDYVFQTFERGKYGLVCYNYIDGDTEWKIKKHLSKSAPVVVNGIVIFNSLNGYIAGYNYASGEEIWSKNTDYIFKNSAAYNSGSVVFASAKGKIFVMDYSSGIIIWEKDLKDAVLTNPVIYKNMVFITAYSGKIYLLDLKNGKDLRQISVNYNLYHSPTIDSTYLYIPCSDGSLKKQNYRSGDKIWLFNGDGPAAQSALVTSNYVYYVTLNKKLYILDKYTGNLFQEVELEGRPRSIPVINNDALILAIEDKYINVFKKNN